MVVVGDDDVRPALNGALENAVVIRVRRDDAQRRARNDEAFARDIGDGAYDFLDAFVLPSEIIAKHPGSLSDDGRRNEELVTSGEGRLPQNRAAPLRVPEGGDVNIRVEDGPKAFGA